MKTTISIIILLIISGLIFGFTTDNMGPNGVESLAVTIILLILLIPGLLIFRMIFRAILRLIRFFLL